VLLNHVAGGIVNANHGIVRADEKLTAFVELEAIMPYAERLSFNHAVFAFALFSRR
jgi:hypothetical protein